MLSLAWVGNIVSACVRLRSPSTHTPAFKWLVMCLLVWISLTLVIIGAVCFYSIAYPYGVTVPTLADFFRLVGGAAYHAAGLSFGLVLGLLLIFRCLQMKISRRVKA